MQHHSIKEPNAKRRYQTCFVSLTTVALAAALVLTIIYLNEKSYYQKLNTFTYVPEPPTIPRSSYSAVKRTNPCPKCFENSCTKFNKIAKCSALLEAKGNRHKLPKLDSRQNFHDLRNVLLVVHFNGEFYGSAPLMDATYTKSVNFQKDHPFLKNVSCRFVHSIFSDIIYCGPSDDDKVFRKQWLVSQPVANLSRVQFVSYGKFKAHHQINPYRCLPVALKTIRKFNYDGVLLASDDVVLNYWNWKLLNMSLNNIWSLFDPEDPSFDIIGGKFCKGKSSDNAVDCKISRWMWPGLNKKELNAFYDELTALANGKKQVDVTIVYGSTRNSSQWTDYWREIKDNLHNVTKGENRLVGLANGDMLYVSRRFLPKIVPLLDLLGKHHVFLEIAVGTAVRAVAALDEIYPISFAGEDWGQGQIRGHPFIESYSTSYVMVHPFKMSKLPTTLNNATAASSKELSTCCVFCNLVNLANTYSKFLSQQNGAMKTIS